MAAYTTPQGFIPAQDRGYIIGLRATARRGIAGRPPRDCAQSESIALGTPGIVRVAHSTIFGRHPTSRNAAALFPVFENRVRLKKGLSAR